MMPQEGIIYTDISSYTEGCFLSLSPENSIMVAYGQDKETKQKQHLGLFSFYSLNK